MRELIPFIFLLACPLMMVFMMRGHRHGGGANGRGDGHDVRDASEPLDELRRRREALDAQIAAREGAPVERHEVSR